MVDPALTRTVEVCKCGHDRTHHSHHDICDICRYWNHDPAEACWGWWPPGSVAVEVDQHGKEVPMANPPSDPDWDDDAPRPLDERVPWRIGVLDKDLLEDPDAIMENAALIADWYVHDCAELLERLQPAASPPPDLDQAIHAAKQALRRVQPQGHWPDVARIAVEAAAPVLLHAHYRQFDTYRLGMIEQLQVTRDRLTTLQGLLRQLDDADIWSDAYDNVTDVDWLAEMKVKVRAALDVDPARENPQ